MSDTFVGDQAVLANKVGWFGPRSVVCRWCGTVIQDDGARRGRGCLSCPPPPPPRAPELPANEPMLSLGDEQLNDHDSPEFQVFKAVAGREAIEHAFGSQGGGHAELRANLERALAEHGLERAPGGKLVRRGQPSGTAAPSPVEGPIMSACPRCGAKQEDYDGFGVLHCEACGYCSHPSMDGDGQGHMVCGLCGATVPS